MAVYKYTAVTNSGERINGSKEASTREEVANFLRSKDLLPVHISEDLILGLKQVLSFNIGGIPLTDKVFIVKQLSTMASANIPLIQAIDILIQQSDKANIKTKLKNVYKAIEAGSTLSDAFRKEKGIFSEVHLSLLAAGEKSANLNEMLEKIADDLDKSRNLKGKITGALIYPVIILIVLLLVIVLMITTMVPQVKDLYTSLGATELPGITQAFVVIGNAFTNPFFLIGMGVAILALIFIFQYINATKGGREFIDKTKLKIPVFGALSKEAEIAQFSRVTAMLLRSGIHIIETLTIVSNASTNVVFKNIIDQAKDEVTKGSSLAVGLAKFNKKYAFPVLLIRIIATGEESGKLDIILEDMGKYYTNEVDQMASNLTKLMEPFIMIIAGVLVGFLAIGIYAPILQIGQLITS